MMYRTTLFAGTLMLASLAQAGGVHYHHAPVVSVQAIYETVRTPVEREVCWEEQRYQRVDNRSRSHTPTVVGAIIGGVIGNQFGGGSGKRAATVAGAALGGSIGRDASRQSRGPDEYYPVRAERCTVQREFVEESRISGYRVAYEYGGQVHHTRTSHHPGDTIRLRVSASPAP
ncbi:MAG: glycine zipper 2TM domain-containing protein [Wenzhouxiangellaceae bacterium]|nr:MAG: glycine zipper 2TM domain-containing protein [Wenzhouxiangellaceae bacterium]